MSKINKQASAPMPYNDQIRVDRDKPVANSEALITSGAVAKALLDIAYQGRFSKLNNIDFDFSHWDYGTFTESINGTVINHFSVLFDSSNRPIQFTDSFGNESTIKWDL